MESIRLCIYFGQRCMVSSAPLVQNPTFISSLNGLQHLKSYFLLGD
jgi:hypothetical protein